MWINAQDIRAVRLDPTRLFYDSSPAEHYHLYHEDLGLLADIATGCVQPEALPPLPAGAALGGVEVMIRIQNVEPADGAIGWLCQAA